MMHKLIKMIYLLLRDHIKYNESLLIMVHLYELLFTHHVQYNKATDSYIKHSPTGSAHEYLTKNSKFHTIMHTEYM